MNSFMGMFKVFNHKWRITMFPISASALPKVNRSFSKYLFKVLIKSEAVLYKLSHKLEPDRFNYRNAFSKPFRKALKVEVRILSGLPLDLENLE